MGCCNPRRAAMSGSPPTLSPGQAAAPAGSGDRVRYLGQGPISVRGPATGIAYAFSAERPVRALDARDARALTRSALFVRAR